MLGIVTGGPFLQFRGLDSGGLGAALGLPQVIRGTVAGDGGDPGPEAVRVALEPARSRATFSQVSDATSSASAPTRVRRYRSILG